MKRLKNKVWVIINNTNASLVDTTGIVRLRVVAPVNYIKDHRLTMTINKQVKKQTHKL